jgi:hypothetical protein
VHRQGYAAGHSAGTRTAGDGTQQVGQRQRDRAQEGLGVVGAGQQQQILGSAPANNDKAAFSTTFNAGIRLGP